MTTELLNASFTHRQKVTAGLAYDGESLRKDCWICLHINYQLVTVSVRMLFAQSCES